MIKLSKVVINRVDLNDSRVESDERKPDTPNWLVTSRLVNVYWWGFQDDYGSLIQEDYKYADDLVGEPR